MRLISAVFCAASVAVWGAAAPALADSPVALEGADEDARRAILDLLPDRDPPTTLFEAERIAEEAAARAAAWLRSEGYYAAEVTPQAGENPPSAKLVIAPGRRFRFAAPEISFIDEAPDADSAGAATGELALIVPDAPARAAIVLQAEAAALSRLQAAGYADAEAGERRVVVDHAAGTVAAEFRYATGARVRLGEVRAEPENIFRQSFLDRLVNWTPGELYAPEKLSSLRRDLISTGAVARVGASLAPANANGTRDVVLDIEPAKRNAYELGVGYSTTEGIGGEAEWTRRNISGRADSLIVSTTLSELAQGVDVELRRPHAAGLNHTVRYLASAVREDTDAYTRQGFGIGAAVESAPRLRMGLSYGVALSVNDYSEAGGVGDATVLSAYGEVRRDTTGHPLDAREGSIMNLRLEPSYSTGDESIAFVRATGEARLYRSFGQGDRYTFATRAGTGWVEPVSGDPNDIPPDRRFYAGGGGSVRGYEYHSIYPEERDLLALTPGGQGLFEVNAEARMRFGPRWGGAVFIDGGSAFDDWEEAADLRWGAGVGVRYDLGFAPLRVDLAVPLDAREEDADYALYISLGQSF